MQPTLHLETLNPHERALVSQFAAYVRKRYGMTLATFLLLELEEGRAMVLDKRSNEYKTMTRWQ